MGKLWQGVVNSVLILVLLGMGAPTTAHVATQPEAMSLSASGAYEEDFTTYTAKDYTERTTWDIWGHTLRLVPVGSTSQRGPAVATDGGGNAIVVWADTYSGNGDIYAQKLDEVGNTLWATALRVNTDAGTASQWSPAVAVDGSGNAVVVWEDGRNANYDIYAQKLDASGNQLWAADARVNSDVGTVAYGSPAVAVDRSGNAVVVWEDERNGNSDIYAQKIDGSGSRLWIADLRVNSDTGTASQEEPALALDESGEALVVWEDYRNENYDIYAHKVSNAGSRLWATDLRVNTDTTTSDQRCSAVATDASGNAVVTWTDKRNENYDIYAQRIASGGSQLWAADLRVNSDSGTAYPWYSAVAVDGSGDAVVTWTDGRNGNRDIYAQKIDDSGSGLWTTDLRVSASIGTAGQYNSIVAVDNDSNIMVVWEDYRNGNLDIYAQKVGESGNRVWAVDLRLNMATGMAGQEDPVVVMDGSGNAVVVWSDARNGNYDIYAQKIDSNGNQLWANDLRVNTLAGAASQWFPAVAIDGSGDVIVVWGDTRNGNLDIYAQRIDGDGNRLWSADLRVNTDTGTAIQGFSVVAVDGSGNAVVVWRDGREGDWDIYAQKIDGSGTRLWATDLRVNVDTGTADRWFPAMAMDRNGNAVVVWSDDRNSNDDIYAQKLSGSGSRLWTADLRVNSDTGTSGQWSPAVAVDGSDNAVVVWKDERNDWDIYAQKIDHDGNRLWAADLRVNTDTGTAYQEYPAVAVDGSGNATVVWEDERNGRDNEDIYAQKIDGSGSRLWTVDLHLNSDAGTTYQEYPSIALDGSGNAVVVWEDKRNGNWDVYAQRVNTVGGKAWLADLQIVYPDFFYFPTGTAQSRSVDTTDDFITAATLTGQYILQGGSVDFYLTNDGGTHWAEVSPGVTHAFTTTGSDLRWRVEMTSNPVWRDRAPIIEQLRIEYETTSAEGDAYEPDDTCAQASPLQVNGAVQAHTFHQPDDEDWAWFDVVSGATYVLQTAHAGLHADTVLELHDVCNHAILTDTNTFGQDARLVFTAPSDATFYARITNLDGDVYGEGTDYDLSVRTYQPHGLAVIVAGHNDGWQLQSNIDYATDQAYLTLLETGFPKANVRYLGPNPNRDVDGNGSHDDIAATATITNVRYAIQDWPREEGLALGVPFYVYLMDHGHYDLFLADGSAGWVTAPLLDLWLSNLEATTGADQITVIIDACKSGSFIDVTGMGPDEISGLNRVIVASTTSQANAYPSTHGSLFSDVFWTALGDNQDVWSAYQTAKTAVEARGLMQTPWLDDNGDAVASGEDGGLARGRGLAGVFGGSEPVIDWLTVGEVSEDGAATVNAQVRDDFAVTEVHVEVYPPGYKEPEAEPGETPELDVPTATLMLVGGNVYTATLTGLTAPGVYRVVGYAVDDEGNWALPQWVMILSGQAVYLPLVMRSY